MSDSPLNHKQARLNPMNFLIFGYGYLGRRVADAWLSRGDSVSAVTRRTANAQILNTAGITPVIADVCDADSLQNLPTADVVLQAVGFDRQSGRTQHEVSVDGMRNVLSAVRDRCRCFIQISSTSVYGQTEGEWVDEQSPTEPTQQGGQANLIAESLVHQQFPAGGGVRAHTLRLAGIYGPGRLLSRIESLQAGTSLIGRGDAWLNLIHVDDAVTAVLACAERGTAAVYNVVDDRPVLRQDYFGNLARLVSAPPPTFDDSQPGRRGSGGLNKRCSNHKLRDELGWQPKYESIESGLPASI